MDHKTNIQELKENVKRFCDERDWDQYHNAKELAISLVNESSELLAHFRYKSEDQIEGLFEDKEKRQQIVEEMSDVFYNLLLLAQRYDIDLTSSFLEKMKKNALKYPVSKSKGSNVKYDDL